MRFKTLGTTLIVVLAIGAAMASNCLAAAEQKASTWRTGSSGTVLSGSETISSTGSGELVTTVGETPLVLKYTGLECLECKIENNSGNAGGVGKLKFTGVTVSEPATCAVSGGAITTASVDVTPIWMLFGLWFLAFHSISGTQLATTTVTKGSGLCPLSGSYIVSGTVFTKAKNATGVYAGSQTFVSSGAINSEAGGELKFGSKAAALNGTLTLAMSGSKAGQVFGTHE